jgi:hypothetical protein
MPESSSVKVTPGNILLRRYGLGPLGVTLGQGKSTKQAHTFLKRRLALR